MFKALRELMRRERGSVMMEFIVVMPIYLVLFGGTCAIGDMLVHSGRLLSADRFSAFFADHGDKSQDTVRGWVETMFKQVPKKKGDKWGDDEVDANGRKRNILTIDSDWHYADSTAPWSVCAAAKTTDLCYIGAGSGIAQLVVGKHWIETGTGKTDTGDFWHDFAQNGFKTLFSRPGVDQNGYKYSYYVLKRKRYFNVDGSKKDSWREVPESSLMKRKYSGHEYGNSAWYDEVCNEGWFDASSIGDNGYHTDNIPHCPEAGANAYWYNRYDQFVTWSK